MLKNKENLKKFNSIIYVVVAIVVFGMAIFALTYMFTINSKKPIGIVSLTANPSVTMTLNSHNRVVDVIYDNKDAETLLAGIDLSGKTIRDASRVFVQRCCESGFIDASQYSIGQSVQVYVAHLNEKKISKLKKSVINQINGYFDENGIIAGAVATQMEDLKDLALQHSMTVNKLIMLQTLEKLNGTLNFEEYVDFNEEELMSIVKEMCGDVKGLSYDYVDEYNDIAKTNLDNLKNDLIVIMQPIYEIADIDFKISLKTTIKDLAKQVENTDLDEETKKQIKDLLKELKKEINGKINYYKNEVLKVKQTFLDDSEQSLDDAKSLLKKKITSYENTFNEGRTYFEKNKAEINEKIKLYRENLELNSSIEPPMF